MIDPNAIVAIVKTTGAMLPIFQSCISTPTLNITETIISVFTNVVKLFPSDLKQNSNFDSIVDKLLEKILQIPNLQQKSEDELTHIIENDNDIIKLFDSLNINVSEEKNIKNQNSLSNVTVNGNNNSMGNFTYNKK